MQILLIMDKRQAKLLNSSGLYLIFLRVDKLLKRTFGHKKSSLIMDKEQSKCFHNGIILIVNCFRFQR